MKKQILATLLVASITISSIFAGYTSPSVILTTTKAETDYSFKVQEITSSSTTDFTDDVTRTVTLNSDKGTTNSFAISTTADGNLHNKMIFKVTLSTDQFIGTEDDEIKSGWFPTITEESTNATSKNAGVTNGKSEVVTYVTADSINGDFDSLSTAKFATSFVAGKHLANTEVARFKLNYHADDELVAGSYISTTTITIAAE